MPTSTVLAYSSPAIGHLFPLVPLLLELRDRGHDVHVRTLASQVPLLRSLGLHAEALDPRVEEVRVVDWRARGTVGALKAAVDTFARRAAYDGPDLRRALAEVQPDVVVVDINSWGASSVAEAHGKPWVRFSPYTPPLTSRGTPPFGPGLAPRHDLLGRVRDTVVRPVVQGTAERSFRPALDALRSGLGLGPVGSADAFFRNAPLMLVTTAPPLEYDHDDWGDRIVMVGAMPWEPPAATPQWLERVEGDLVLVSTSSEYQHDERLVRTAVEGLADGPWTVVATMPAGLVDLGPLPGNVVVEQFVPHGRVLDRAVAAVTHGGMGVTQKALARSVPVCVVPFGRDQLEVAARVVHAGAGTRLSTRRLAAATLRAGVEAAVAQRPGAARVAAGYAAAGGAPRAADEVERLVRAGVR
jgi:MGT family glycosyltransferase